MGKRYKKTVDKKVKMCYDDGGKMSTKKKIGVMKMQLKNEKVTFRLPTEIREQIEQVAQRYDMSISDATLFLVSCGLDVEKDYRPVIYVANKVKKFAEKMENSGVVNGTGTETSQA